ncbi:MAG: DUF2291 family protein [Spirosomataceae bacterium]
MPPLEKKKNKSLQWFKYGFGSVVVLLLAYNSVYFRKLDEVKAEASGKFNAAAFAENFLAKQLSPQLESAPDIDALVTLLTADKNKAFAIYSHATAVGNIRYFLVKGQGQITEIRENEVAVQTPKNQLILATEFIYGNALRDASGQFDITKFTKTADINNVSSELNKIIRNKVAAPFKAKAKAGDKLQFSGAIELNIERLNLKNIEVIPATIQVIK